MVPQYSMVIGVKVSWLLFIHSFHRYIQHTALFLPSSSPPSSGRHKPLRLLFKSKHIYRLPSLLISREAFCLQKIRSKFLARVRMIYVRRGGLLFLVTALSTICAKPKEYLVKYNLGRQWSMEEGRESCHRAVVTVGIKTGSWSKPWPRAPDLGTWKWWVLFFAISAWSSVLLMVSSPDPGKKGSHSLDRSMVRMFVDVCM